MAQLVERARRLTVGPRRLLGITGAPGAGKSTLAEAVASALGPERAVLVGMDGFHLDDATLRAWGRHDRKGAPDTFDAHGYLHLLTRLVAAEEEVVHAPRFDRGLETSIGSAVPVPREVPLVVTEGNYLLLGEPPWVGVAELLDECWYLELPADVRRQRLTERHRSHGRDQATAHARAHGSDEANARLVATTRARAGCLVRVLGP